MFGAAPLLGEAVLVPAISDCRAANERDLSVWNLPDLSARGGSSAAKIQEIGASRTGTGFLGAEKSRTESCVKPVC